MAAPRPKKKTVKKAKATAKDDGFKRFKKMYEGGEVKKLANPPPLPGAGGGVLGIVAKVGSKAAKDLRSSDPKALRNEALRLANRVAKQNKPKYKEKIGPNRPQGPEAPKYLEKIGPRKPDSKRPIFSRKGGKLYMRKDAAVAAGAAGAPLGMAIGAGIYYLANRGEKQNKPTLGSDKKAPKYRKPAPGANYTPKKSSGFGKRISESAKFERLRATRAALGSKSSDSGSLRKAAGTYTASYDVKNQKSGPSNTAATTAATSGSNGGGSQAANVANAGGKAKVGRQTRYQRESLAMEQRKRSSSKPKKSIFSLFRKG